MIRIFRNPNFTQWFNITLHGKLVDNAKTRAVAVRIAENLKAKDRSLVIKS